METGTPSKRLLPSNAYRKLEPGETYQPIVPAASSIKEVTPWSVGLGLVMVVIFTAACVYIALRAGTGIEAAIPIAVAAIFFGRLKASRSTILENVIVQSIGQASGVVAAGAAFVAPAIYINQVTPSWWQILLACALGGFLGIVLIIPLRKYFVVQRHGELPFPEATATTEILVSGEQTAGGGGKILVASFGLGAVFDFLIEAVHAWNPIVTSRTLLGRAGEWLADLRFELKGTLTAALFGVGYIIGIKYAAIIFAGSVLAFLVITPLLHLFGSALSPEACTELFYRLGVSASDLRGIKTISEMGSDQIFKFFVKPIGIGAIATAGIIGLIRMGKIIGGSLTLGFKGFSRKGEPPQEERTQRDMRLNNALLIEFASTLALGVLFFVVCRLTGQYTVGQALTYAVAGMGVALLLCFLFTPIAAEAIAIVGVNPVSGMTLVTVVIGSLIMAAVGLSGTTGAFVTLVIGIAVCTALSVAGALISDFKIGYWIGATPRNQQIWKFLGIGVAALVAAFVIPLMDQSYHFLLPGTTISNEEVLPAPQANMIGAVVKGLTGGGQQPFILYGIGGLVAILAYMAGIPPLAFALGMFLPIGLTFAQLLGGFVAWLISRSGKDAAEKEARKNQGTLIASGLMAGAAIMGIVAAVLRLEWTGYAVRFLSIGEKFFIETSSTGVTFLKSGASEWFKGLPGQGLGLVMFIALAIAVWLLARWGGSMEHSGKSK